MKILARTANDVCDYSPTVSAGSSPRSGGQAQSITEAARGEGTPSHRPRAPRMLNHSGVRLRDRYLNGLRSGSCT
jgi:hypothetical protein